MAPTRLRLELRHYGALRGPLVAVALVVVALSGLLAAAPAVFARLAATEIAQTTANAPTAARYLTAQPAGRILNLPSRDPATSGLGDADPMYGTWQDQLAALRNGLPEPLRSHVGAADWTTSFAAVDVGPNPAGMPPSASTSLATVLDVHPDRVAKLIAGQWPRGGFGETHVDLAISQEAATTLGASVGSEFGAYRIVGIFEPDDVNADYWLLNPGLVRAQVKDNGNDPIETVVTAFVDAQQAGMQPASSGSGFTGEAGKMLVWLPLQLDGVTPERAERLLTQLGGVVAARQPVPADVGGLPSEVTRGTVQEISLSAEMIGPLAGALGRINSASAVLQVALAGPLLAVFAVLIAALAALVRRGRAATALQMTRGATSSRIRLRWAGAGLLAGVPAAMVAVAAVSLIFGASAPRAGLATGAAIGLVPAVLLALAPRTVLGADAATAKAAMTTGHAPARDSASARSGHRWRLVIESAVLLAAAVSTYLLLSTGLDTPQTPTATAAGSDLFVVAAPALLIAATCVIVLRLYPLPLRAIAARARRRRGVVGFVGSLRALRDPITGIVPAVAILAGVAVAGLSGALVSTIDTGTASAALTELGAPIRVTMLSFEAITDDEYAQVTALDSVAAAARFGRIAMEPVTIPGRNTKPTAELFLADLAALPRVQQGVTGAPPALGTPAAEPTLAGIGSDNLAPAGTTVTLGSQHTLLSATADSLPGITRSRTFILLDSSTTAFGRFHPQIMLVAPAPGADEQQLEASLSKILGPKMVVDSAADTVTRLRSGALATGMRLALYGALIAAAAATIVALLISVLAATATRARLMAIARVVGFTRGQRRRLIVWEQAPVAVAALLGGAGLGLGLAALVHRTVDVAPFTGGRVTPPLTIDWPVMAALFLGFLAVVALAVAVGMLLTRRTTAATAIKLDED